MHLQFSDTEIALIATELDLDLADPEKIAILKSSESCDIQAGPGSGKTTILAAKLALLSKKWPWADRGILVLSHTNVARREVEAKLSRSMQMRQLLSYPHFIGTFQAFVDQFLALPYIRQQQIEVTAIDNERFGAQAISTFEKGPWYKARAYLNRRYARYPDRVLEIIAGLRFDGPTLRVAHPAEGENRFPKGNSPTGRELANLKSRLAQRGYFHFEDMYAFAEACLAKLPYVGVLLRHRFPWVFVDELQDTKPGQDRIVEALFGGTECVLQRLGDKNQAIFDFNDDSDGTPDLFGRRKTLPLSTTHRFGDKIAGFASALTVMAPQTLIGLPGLPERPHTIFLYSRNKVAEVVPAFANLVLTEVPLESRKARDICVVGSRKNIHATNPANFPQSLCEYWDGFQSDLARKPTIADTLLGFVVETRAIRQKEKTLSDAFPMIIGGVLEIVRRSTPAGHAKPITTRNAIQDVLRQRGQWLELKRELWGLLHPDAELTEERWNDGMKKLLAVLQPCLIDPTAPELQAFLKWSPAIQALPKMGTTAAAATENVFVHQTATDTMRIRFDTIHGVKGETHAATLVVETFFNRTHDLKSLLPVLTGTKKAPALTGNAVDHCKRVFVGMTRPRELVCLAMFAEHVTETDVTSLERAGWQISKLL